MNRRSLDKLRTDRRLAGRRGWISKTDLASEAEGLPDASGKVAKEAADESGARKTAPAPASPQNAAGLDTA